MPGQPANQQKGYERSNRRNYFHLMSVGNLKETERSMVALVALQL
jgi:hypothetical protein